jgi:hypothetical protein
MFVNEASILKVDYLKGASLANIRQGSKGLYGKNTLAYYCRQKLNGILPWLKQNEQTYWQIC